MPSKYSFHKNRSHGSLLNHLDPNEGRSYQASPIDSPLQSPAYSPHSASPSLHDGDDDDDDEDHRHGHSNRSDGAHFYQLGFPTRSQSHRTPPSIHTTHNPSINLVAPSNPGAAPASLDEDPNSFYQQVSTSTTHREDSKRRRFFGLGNPKEPTNNNGAFNPQKVGRGLSVRKKVPTPPISTEPNSRLAPQRYPGSIVPPAAEEEEKRGGRAGLGSSHPQFAGEAPPIPEKDPLRSPHFSNLQQQESPYTRPPLQGVPPNTVNRPPLDRQGSANSSAWENPVRPAAYPARPQSEVPYRQPPLYQSSPASATSTSSYPLPSQGAREKFQQYYQANSRPSSRQSSAPPSPTMPQPPPPGRGSNNPPLQRQPSELPREGSGYHPSYPQVGQESSQPPGAPQYRSLNPSEGSYRAPPPPSSMASQNTADQGRNSPPPSRSRDDLAGLDTAQLLIRHDELQEKYRKVKKYYFDKEAQVQQLQNTLAHQRLAQSRTSLDDNEYGSRFARLDGAINNLSFNIRRDWRAVPPWLGPHVNRDAPTLQTREMTAVGRACISRWLVDELLDRYFHPSLEPSLSAHLKIIEKNLRRFAAPTPSEEEKDALLARISNWRLATLDGLHDMLFSPQAAEYRSQLTEQLVEKMTASLSMSLKEPPPAGLEGGVAMIIELAVGIAANLPLESRDVFVEYIAPGALVNEAYMKVESGLPPLTNPGEGILEGGASGVGDKTSEDSSATEPKDNIPGEERPVRPVSSGGAGAGAIVAGSGSSTKESKKKSMFGGLMGGGKKAGAAAPSTAHQQQAQPPPAPKEDRVRFAAFMAVEVRGRSVLVKAPVYIH